MSLKILTHDVTLAVGITQSRETLLALVPVTIEDRTFETEFIILLKARECRIDTENYASVTAPPYRMLKGISDEPKVSHIDTYIAISSQERESMLKLHHESPTAGH
ncbi:hypothetical protein CDAR_197691 [Caerostris darwini]|uniref:Uncharacterized protein n=1 Tax=Caerostris darwini TaxID=1538125 RepID=A0AAV4VVB1_9ARAC|nr:hypothetical protein CDAR_197691 [Caerostris darwini]